MVNINVLSFFSSSCTDGKQMKIFLGFSHLCYQDCIAILDGDSNGIFRICISCNLSLKLAISKENSSKGQKKCTLLDLMKFAIAIL